jgi:hypothetical protein
VTLVDTHQLKLRQALNSGLAERELIVRRALNLAVELAQKPRLLLRRGYRILQPGRSVVQEYEFSASEDDLSVLSVSDGWAYFLTRAGEFAVMPCPSGSIQRYPLRDITELCEVATRGEIDVEIGRTNEQDLPPWARTYRYTYLVDYATEEAEAQGRRISGQKETYLVTDVIDILEALKRSLAASRGEAMPGTTASTPCRQTTVTTDGKSAMGADENGIEIWRAVFGGNVSVARWDTRFYLFDKAEVRCLDGRQGFVQWTFRLNGDTISAPVMLGTLDELPSDEEPEVVFVGTENGYVLWLDAETGVELGRIWLTRRVSRIAWPLTSIIVETVSGVE